MIQMRHLPFTISFDVQTGCVRISQPMSLDDVEDQVHIDLTLDQAQQAGKFLLSCSKTATPPTSDGTAIHFPEFWEAYPSKRRVDKEGCIRKWRQRKLDDQVGAILPHLSAMASSDAWKKDGGQFVPMITTYLNQSRWQAEAEGSTAPCLPPQV